MKIRGKIFISLFTLFIIIMGLLGGVYFLHINNLLIEDRFEVLDNLVVNTGEQVKEQMSRGYLDIQLLSENPVLKSNLSTTEEKLELLNLVENTYGIYDDISLIDINGNVITSTSFVFEGGWEKKEWFEKAKEGNITISNAHLITNPKEIVVNYLSPIIDNEGNISSVVSIRYPLNDVWSLIESIEIGEKGYIYILNSFNMYIAHPDKELILTAPSEHIPFAEMTQKKGTVEYLELDNTEMVASYYTLFESKDYKQEGWKVVVVQPKEEILSIINQSNVILLIIMCIGIIGIIGISYLLTKIIIKPINALKEHTLKISKGELDTKLNLVSKDELADLAKTFNQMTFDLKKSKIEIENHSKRLESKVDERTKELTNSKNNLQIYIEKLEKNKIAMINLTADMQKNIYALEKAKETITGKNLELKDTHEMLQSVNITLEKKVKERTEEIERLLLQKDEFVNQLGHDLKNPLGPLLNLIPLLEENEKDTERKEIFDILKRNTNHMKNLVVKTIELAKLNSPDTKLSFEDTNLLTQIDNVIVKSKLLFSENNIEIENKIGENIIVKADKLRLTELFDNIIGNSVKYSSDSGTITIDAKRDKDFVTVSIKDNGMGMREDQLSHIFD